MVKNTETPRPSVDARDNPVNRCFGHSLKRGPNLVPVLLKQFDRYDRRSQWRSADLGFTVTKFGNSMKNEIINNHATDIAYLTKLQGRGTPITKDDPARITVEKSATNPRTFPNPPEYLPDVAEGFDWCNWHSNVFGVSQTLVEMTLIGNRSEAQMKKVLGLDISDRITFVGTNDAGLGINEDFFIESQRYVMDPKTNIIQTTWAISAISALDAWTLGTSALGESTRLAYA